VTSKIYQRRDGNPVSGKIRSDQKDRTGHRRPFDCHEDGHMSPYPHSSMEEHYWFGILKRFEELPSL
jgi:hypothetical protein